MIPLKENDIRPQVLFDRYLELSRQDALAMLAQADRFVESVCPGCGDDQGTESFQKNGFMIKECGVCQTIYCSPRPSAEQLARFYADSPSTNYWANDFFPAVLEARREKLFIPKALEIARMLKANNFLPKVICDVGAGYGLLLEALRQHWPEAEFRGVEPGEKLSAICGEKGFQVNKSMVEDMTAWQRANDLVICLEVIEHVFDPLQFVSALYRLVKPGGFCLVTGLGGDGFDIRTLGKNSKSIFPPHHLNFISVEGFRCLFRKAGFSDIQVTTPGQLDLDIVLNSNQEGSEIASFFKVLARRGEAACREFQEYLVRHQLSSHVWILARR